ncbi:MAG: dual specificity protein phosphatase family protein [Chloroflexota bacterium]|nr:MAG: dual specificity protein phosphatase family protein [Chloroflexota bacterium]
MELTELPYPFPGRVFRSAMPYSSYDPEGRLIQAYQENDISMVVVLTSDEEMDQVTGRRLRSLYQASGLEILSFPIPDFNVPDIDLLHQVVAQVSTRAQSGQSTVIHCHAGLGRTGMFLACLAKMDMNFTAQEAVAWVRKNLPGAIEVPSQEQIVRVF